MGLIVDCLSQGLADDGAKLHIYDPKVTEEQIMKDLSTPKFEWDHPSMHSYAQPAASASVTFHKDVYSACKSAHGIAVLTEWDEFKTLDFERVYKNMNKPAFVFDGRNILDHEALRDIGFIVYGLGKPLDAFIKKSYA